MLHRVFGASGSGKTAFLLQKLKTAVKAGKTCFYIVPEQQSVETEKSICRVIGNRGAMSCETLNFERLPNRVAREHGMLAANYIDKGGRDLLMTVALRNVSKSLKEYGKSCNDFGFVQSCVAAVGRFKAECVTPQRLKELSELPAIAENARLSRKLHDMALITNEYASQFGDGLCDSFDALDTLAKTLSGYSFFNGSTVFIDGYYTFTGQELEIIKAIVSQSDDCFISFVSDSRSLFSENNDCAARIKRICPEADDIFVGEPCRARTESLKFIEQNLWSDRTPEGEADGSVSVISAKNMFDECEAIASSVLETVKGGMRYRDICILTGDGEGYAEVLESVLSHSGIPCFSSHKENVLSRPLFSFVLSLLETVSEDFSVSSVRKYIKSGFSGLGVEESDFLLRYVEMWGISGVSGYNGGDWRENPSGYRAMRGNDKSVLSVINRARAKLVSTLLPLYNALKVKKLTVGEEVKLLYAFVAANEDANKTLETRVNMFRENGDEESAKREEQLYDILVNLFDQLYTLAKDIVMPPDVLHEVITIMCREYSVGSIPSSADAVSIGDPRLFRSSQCKAAIICGATDGVFPSYCKGDLFFDDDELVLLEGEGCFIAPPRDRFIARERFLFYVACTMPSERLILTYPESDTSGRKLRPSLGVLRIQKLFPNLVTRSFGESEADYLYSLSSAADRYPLIQNKGLKAKTEALLKSKGAEPSEASDVFMPKSDINVPYVKTFTVSPTAFELYAKCPFSYFAETLMRLHAKEKFKFAQAQTGSFIHSALEEFVNKRLYEKTADEIEAYAEDFVKNSFPFASLVRHEMTRDDLVYKLKMLFKDLAEEFSQSAFRPLCTEFELVYPNGSVETQNGETQLYIKIKVDRADVLKLDGAEYLRVIDYKNYNKDFRPKLIEFGLESQLPLYLFGLCGDKYVPAGCMYYSMTLKPRKRKKNEDYETFLGGTPEPFRRNGIYTSAPKVLESSACNGSSKRFVPVRFSKGELHKQDIDAAYDGIAFTKLKETVMSEVRARVTDLLCGRTDIKPVYIDRGHDACTFCKYRQACRYEGR